MMTEIRYWDYEHGRWEVGTSLWDGKGSLSDPAATQGTLVAYVPSDNFRNGELISVDDGRSVVLPADAGSFRSTWKAA